MLIFGALTRDLVNLNQFCHILVSSVHPFCVIFSWLTRNDFKTLQVYQPPTTCFKSSRLTKHAVQLDIPTILFFQSHLLAVLHCSFENQLVDFTLHLRMIEDGGFQWVKKRLGGVDSLVSIDVFVVFSTLAQWHDMLYGHLTSSHLGYLQSRRIWCQIREKNHKP